MTQAFRRTATVEFAIRGTDQTVTVNNIPYIWQPAVTDCLDQEGVFAAMDYLRPIMKNVGLDTISVTTSPA
tara:strand:+ start:55 stop:267 length:213 start_codon:yes stop_codon:yes gene_type:complete